VLEQRLLVLVLVLEEVELLGLKVCAKVGGVSEGGKSIEDKDKDKGKGKDERTVKENGEERVEGKGKAQESTKGEEKKPNETEKEDAGDERKPDLWSILDLGPHHVGSKHQH
jgi:hypothetical protein